MYLALHQYQIDSMRHHLSMDGFIIVKVARGQIEKAAGIRKRLNQTAEAPLPSVQLNNTTSQPSFTQPSMSFCSFPNY